MQLFVEQLTVIDCGFVHPRHGLVGASWIVDASLEGEPDATGMILDFGPAKRWIKRRIDALVDHRLLAPAAAAPAAAAAAGAEPVSFNAHGIAYRGPRSGLCLLPGATVGRAAVAAFLENAIGPALPANVRRLRLTLREQAIAGASYNYCHGLRQHAGPCQRIGHGHRSRLEISLDGARDPRLESYWARRWRNAFIADGADLLERRGKRWRFGYAAGEGEFELELDAARCQLLDGPPTVENIAAYLAAEVRRQAPGRRVTVRAFEGVGKGALVSAAAGA